MKLIKIFLLFLILIIISGISSCRKSFLDVEDNSVFLREQYVNDIPSLQQYLNGIYILLSRDFYNGTAGPQIYTDLIADNIKPSTSNSSTLSSQYSWSQDISTSNNNRSNMSSLWINGYKLIRSCNFAIERAMELRGKDVAKADFIIGEAYGIKTLVNFVLVNTFAQSYNFTPDASHQGVPYITSWDWNDDVRRNTVKEVYEGMINDLKVAIPLLPASNNNKIVMNQYAAKALLGRIYLFMEKWEEAKSLSTEVASAIPLLASSDYPGKLFTSDETEAFFQLAPSSTNAVQSSYSTAFQGFYFRSTAFMATRDIADLLTSNPNDKRKMWINNGGIGNDSIRKYPINVVPGFASGPSDVVSPRRSYYQTLLRSSEMFLTVSEASARLGDESTAKTYLDAIRLRANPTAPAITAVGDALLDSIYLERRKELAFEGFRMWDLLRLKRGVVRSDAATGAPLTLSFPSDKAIAPIPQQDVILGVPQNPAY